MRVGVLASLGLRSLARHPLRSGLTLLGFAIGVGSFVAMVSFAEGAHRAVIAQFEALGRGTLIITAGGGATGGEVRVRLFTIADGRELQAEVEAVSAVAPLARQALPVAAQGRSASTLVIGTTPEFTRIRTWQLESGGMFDHDDVSLGARVCVVGRTVVDRLFDGGDPVGLELRIGDVVCRVVGTLTPLGQVASGQDQDDLVLVPMPLFERRIAGRPGADRLLVGISPDADFAAARRAVEQSLRARRRVAPDAPSDFEIKSPDDLTRIADRTATLLSGLLGATAAVSLLVGGIGIMNILLVSVGERTREIGVRVAVGATPAQVLTQFLIEATTLAGIGASVGAALGGVASVVVGQRLGWDAGVPVGLIVGSMAGGMAVGLIFGLYPARRAAMLEPVAALRGE